MTVQHVTLFHASVCSGLFITPSCCKLHPLIPSDLEKINALVATSEVRQLHADIVIMFSYA